MLQDQFLCERQSLRNLKKSNNGVPWHLRQMYLMGGVGNVIPLQHFPITNPWDKRLKVHVSGRPACGFPIFSESRMISFSVLSAILNSGSLKKARPLPTTWNSPSGSQYKFRCPLPQFPRRDLCWNPHRSNDSFSCHFSLCAHGTLLVTHFAAHLNYFRSVPWYGHPLYPP